MCKTRCSNEAVGPFENLFVISIGVGNTNSKLALETYQAQELLVFPLSKVAWNGDSIWQVVGESIDRIIDDDCLGKVTPKPVQVLREHVQMWDWQAVLPVQPVGEEPIFRIKELNARVSIVFLLPKSRDNIYMWL